MTARKSWGRMEFRLGRDKVAPWGYKKDRVVYFNVYVSTKLLLNITFYMILILKNWSLVSHTGLAGGNIAARSPRILSLEHSENTCSRRGTWGSLSSVSLMSEVGELTVPGTDSEAENGNNKTITHTHLIQAVTVCASQESVLQSAWWSLSTYVGPLEREGPRWTQRVSGWGWQSPECLVLPVSFSLPLQCSGVITFQQEQREESLPPSPSFPFLMV